MEEWFIIVSHTIEDCVGQTKPTIDLKEALAIQLAILIGCPVEVALLQLDDEIISDARACLTQYGRYRICNDEEEVYIFSIPAKETFR